MPSRIRHITVDCRSPYPLARFWADVLGFVDDPANPNRPDDPEALIIDPSGAAPGLLFVPVPEAKTVKNRVHLDLQPSVPRDDAVARAVAAGGVVVADHRTPDGAGWVVVSDPEGNEFCIERSAHERDDSPAPSPASEREMPLVRSADERTMLLAMLDWYRLGVVDKITGVDRGAVRRSVLPTGTTLIGLVKHLALVEDSWVTERFAGQPLPEPWLSAPWDDDLDWDFHSAAADEVDDVVALYEAACERSRTVCESAALDDANAAGSPSFTLRWAIVHLLEETARHLGHIDILRELADGTAGE